MTTLTVGAVDYRLVVEERAGGWVAHAERVDTGDRFGVDATGVSEADARGRLATWLQWQDAHAAALTALQLAEHDFHRVVAGSAFAGPSDGPTPSELRRDALDRVEAARLRLDDVRARRPAM